LTGHTNIIDSLIVLSDGTLASCSGDLTIRLWDTKTGQTIRILTGHTIRIFTGHTIRILTGHTIWVDSLAILSDGTLVSGGDDNEIRFWDKNWADDKNIHTNWID
jgi:WD40 repeat protein